MTVLYIGDFTDSFSTENYIVHGLRSLGCTVYCAPERHVPNAKVVLGAALQYKVDFVLFSKGRFSGSDEVVALLRSQGIITVGWVFDLFFDHPSSFGRRQMTSNSFEADICCMTDGGHLDKWQQLGVNYRLLRQGIHEPEAHYGTPEEAPHPSIVFIGTASYPERGKMIDHLHAVFGNEFRHYGRGGTAREIRGQALNNVLASAKIVVGDSVPSPHYWSNRIYEVLGRGGFLLHPQVEGLDTEFTDGVHYSGYIFGDLNDLDQKIRYYLKHEDEREKIRRAGHEHCKAHYTYTHRCKQLLTYVSDYRRDKQKQQALLEPTSAILKR